MPRGPDRRYHYRRDHYQPYVPPRGPDRRYDNKRHDFRRREVNHLKLDSLTKLPSEILATELQLQLPPCPPTVAPPKKENLDRYCEYHGEKGHYTNDCFHLKKQLEIALESGKLNHLVKDVRQRGNNQGRPMGNNNRGKIINMVYESSTDRKFNLCVILSSLHQLVYQEPKFLIKMFPRRSKGEELEYPFFEGDGSSSDEWRDYGMGGDDYEGPPIFDDDQYEEESMPVYDTDIEDVIEEEEGFIEKGGFGVKKDNIKDIVVVANDLCSSMIQTTLNVDFGEDINTKSHELVSFAKSIIIKSKTEARMIKDIAEHFDKPDIKSTMICNNGSFGVMEGKFLGYMVTSEGIRANLKKTKAVADMQSPRTLKEMQSLSGKLATLNRFLSRSAERSLPFFETLKNITKEFKEDYRWTEEAEHAFQELKKLILELPTLTTPERKESLFIYLATSREAVSGVLVADRRGKQTPIRYVSRTLHEAERNYAPLEKLALCLLHLSRRLRRYFEAHPIQVITEQPIKQILNKPKSSGKLAKYAVELGAYNITYIPRTTIKGQVLADFINEVPVGVMQLEVCNAAGEEALEEWILYTDGASSQKGAEYEALLAGLRMARKMKVQALNVKVDSKLVACQMNGEFVANDKGMAKYLAKAKEQASSFKKFSIKNIPRNQNQKADVLSKLALVAFNHLTKEILVEVLNAKSVDTQEVSTIVEEEEDNWMTPIIKCLGEGIWPTDENEARVLQTKISQYVIEDGVLFKKPYISPMLRCVGPLQENYIIREVHEGAFGMHAGARSVVAKIMRQGYYWPTMHGDTKEVVDKCDSCQVHAPVPKLPKTRLTFIMSPWPFYQWGLDILGPLPKGPDKLKFIIVAIDYFTKWIEAKPLAKTTEMEDKADEHIGGTPASQWFGGKRQWFGTLKARLGREKVGWVDELPNVLWAHRTMLKTSNGETPFNLTYVSEAVIPAKIGMPTYRTIHFNEAQNEEEMRLNLDLTQERREAAAIREAKYKNKVEQYYNKRVRPMAFKVGDFVYRRNAASRVENQGKLGLNWEGPYRVIEAYDNGSYKLTTMNDKEVPRTWHAINLRNCFM
ncbi:reverse transcriptase domain-containing protein [Tanacetum coccineum]